MYTRSSKLQSANQGTSTAECANERVDENKMQMTAFPIYGLEFKQKKKRMTESEKANKTISQTYKVIRLFKRISFSFCPFQLWFPATVRLFFFLKVSPPRTGKENACYQTIYLFLNLCSSISITVYKSFTSKSKGEITEIISTLLTQYQIINTNLDINQENQEQLKLCNRKLELQELDGQFLPPHQQLQLVQGQLQTRNLPRETPLHIFTGLIGEATLIPCLHFSFNIQEIHQLTKKVFSSLPLTPLCSGSTIFLNYPAYQLEHL